MTDYLGYRDERVIYRSVSFPDFREGAELGSITGGTLDISALSDLRASGTLDFSGAAPKAGSLIRIYYEFVDSLGERFKQALATLFVSQVDPRLGCETKSGTMSLESVLTVPMNAMYGDVYTVDAGKNAVDEGIAILERLGLSTNRPTSDYKLSNVYVSEPDDNYLKIANQLFAMAGYAASMPDAYGTVQVIPYVEPQSKTSVWTFSDGDMSIMSPDVTMTDNGRLPNAYRVKYETESRSYKASAVNVDPESDISTVSLHREITEFESLSEVAGSTDDEILSTMKSYAEKRLRDNTQRIEYVEFGHPWLPIYPNDAITVSYSTHSIRWTGSITDMSISLGDHIAVTTRARRIERERYKIETEGIAW